MTELNFKTIPPNYVWYHGGIMSDIHTEMYNEQSKEIAELELTGMNKGYLEQLRNARHKLVQHYLPS